MNLAGTISLYAYGTSEGVTKGWDTRGRGRKEVTAYHGISSRSGVSSWDKLINILREGKIRMGESTVWPGEHAVYAYPGRKDVAFTHDMFLEFKDTPDERRQIGNIDDTADELLFNHEIPISKVSRILIRNDALRSDEHLIFDNRHLVRATKEKIVEALAKQRGIPVVYEENVKDLLKEEK